MSKWFFGSKSGGNMLSMAFEQILELKEEKVYETRSIALPLQYSVKTF